MWSCNWGFPSAHGGWFMGHGLFGLFVGIVLIAMVVYLLVSVVKTVLTAGRKTNSDAGDSLEIVKRKFARGEISEEEYRRMKDILTG